MNNPAIIGVIPEFSYTEGLTVSEVTIAAEIGAANRANTVGTYAQLNPEFEGIKRLNFFRFFEEINTLLPVETTFDISKNMMYTKTDELGTYCIMDMEIWLDSLGGAELLEAAQAESEPETEPDAETMRVFTATNLRLESKVDVQPLGATMAVSPVLPGENEAVAESLAATDNFNIIFVATGTIETGASIDEFMQITAKENWHTVPYYIKSYNGAQAGALANKCDISLEIEKALNAHYKNNMENFVFVMAEEELIYSDTPTGLSLRNKVLNYTKGKIHLSIVSDYSSLPEESFFAQLVDTTSGTLFNTNGYEKTDDYEKAENLAWNIYNWLIGGADFKYISSVGLTELPSVFNKAYLSEIYHLPSKSKDYDKDGFSDFSEIAFEANKISSGKTEDENVKTKEKLIKFDSKGNVILPTIHDCMYYVEKDYGYVFVKEAFDRYIVDLHEEENGYNYTSIIRSTKIVPIDSDPVLADSDGDGFLDSINNNFEKKGYYIEADKWPLTSKPHAAFYQENGEYYFNKIRFPSSYVGGREYERKSANFTLSEEQQDYVYRLCEISDVDPLLVFGAVSHESNSKLPDNVPNGKYAGYMQFDVNYSDEYTNPDVKYSVYNGKLKDIIDYMVNHNKISENDLNLLKKSDTPVSTKHSIINDEYVSLTFGIACLQDNYRLKNGDWWETVKLFCGSEEEDDATSEKYYYRNILALLLEKEKIYEEKYANPNGLVYSIYVNGSDYILQ